MGKLIYGAPTWSVEFEDRALAHLRIVMIAKLRRAESFSLLVEVRGGVRERPQFAVASSGDPACSSSSTAGASPR